MGKPTDELRARLDELGVEYDTYDLPNGEHGVSWIDGNGIEWETVQRGENFEIHALQLVTPEQAIAATVGAETCKRVYHPNRITKTCTCSNCGYGASDERWAYCPKCGHKYVHGEVEERWRRAGRKVAE